MLRLTFASTLLLAAASAFGHGVQIQATFNQATEKIETRQIVYTGSLPTTITPLTRVYVMPLLETAVPAGNGWYSRAAHEVNAFNVPLYPTGPGLTFQYDEPGQLPGTGWSYSGSATLPNLQGTNFGFALTDGLKAWDGLNFVDPGAEQIQVFGGDGASVPSVFTNTSDAGPFGSLALATIASKSSNPHSSVGFRMLGDGLSVGSTSPQAGDDGIYLLSMQLTSTASGVGSSDPFYFVLFKNALLSSAIEVAGTLGFAPSHVQVVPEPSAIGMVLLGLLAVCGRFGGRA